MKSIVDVTKEQMIQDIINPLPLPKYCVDYGFRNLQKTLEQLGQDWGGLELDPDYQRGHVWTMDQRTAFVEAMMRGTLTDTGITITFNCANWESDELGDLKEGITCVDGLQRLTTLFMLHRGEIKPFGMGIDDFEGTSFSFSRGRKYSIKFQMMAFKYKADLLAYYLAINSGGTPHSDVEIARIKGMLEQLNQQ